MKNLLFSAVLCCCAGTAFAEVIAGDLYLNATQGEVQTFTEDLLFRGWRRVLNVPAGVTAVFEGNVAHADTTGCSVHLNGEGTKVLRGGMKMAVSTDADNDAYNNASRLQYGTFLVEGDVDLPRYYLGNTGDNPPHLVVTNGAMIRNWKNVNSFIQSCTIDLAGGRFVNDGALILAQATTARTKVNVLRDGVFSTGAGFRPANNGYAEFTVEEGGTLHWLGGVFSENGQMTFTLNGGRVVRGTNGRDVFYIGQNPANDTSYQNKGGNVLNLNGGELWAAALSNNSNVNRNKGTPTTVNLNGATLMCNGHTDSYWQGHLASLVLNVQAGGARIDTRGANVGWNHAASGEGGLVKLGVGRLTISAKQTFAGPVQVWVGSVALTDPSFVTQRVVLAPGGAFAPGGAATLAGLTSSDGILHLVCSADATALSLEAAPLVGGTLFLELLDATGEPLSAPGTYAVIAAPDLPADLAARCVVRNGPADRVYTFTAVDGVLSVTVAEGTNPYAGVTRSTWTAAAGGDWTDAANWSAGVPDGMGAEATLGASGAGPVALSRDVTVAALNFAGEGAYSVTGPGTLNFASPSGYTYITANGGTHEIAASVATKTPVRVQTSNGGKLLLSGDLSGAKDIQIVNGTVTSPGLNALPKFLFAEGVFEYTGTGAGTAEGELRQNGNATVCQMAGAGPMTLKLAPYLSTACTLRLQGNGTSEVALDGTGWNTQPLSDRRLWLDGGDFRFMPGLRLGWINTGSGMTRVGSVTFDRPTTVVMEDGARMQGHEVWIGAERGSGSAVRFEQRGGDVLLKGDLDLNPVAQTNAVVWETRGGELTGESWLNLMHGPATFRQTAGATTFKNFAFGYQTRTDGNYTNSEKGPQGLLDLRGGTLSVSDTWNWTGDNGGRRVDRVRVSGGELTLPATFRAVAYDAQKPASFSTLELAGGTLRFGGAVHASASADDYLSGLNYLSLTGEAAVDVPADATVTQPLLVASDATGLTKTGAGALTLAGTNDVPAKVSVATGTLAAAFRTDAQANMPDGLLAYWTFDGEDPCRDATGHGYDLQQAVTDTKVQFSEVNAHVGKSAWWQTSGGVLKCTAMTSALLQRATISLWVRLETKNYSNSHIGMFSMRNNLDATGHMTSFDLAYKGTINASMQEPGIGNCFFGSALTGIPRSKGGDISVKEWHMITVTRDESRVRSYVDGVLCMDVELPEASRGSTLLEQGRMITLGGNICGNGSFREAMNVDGRLDDVAIFSRCLTDDEVARLHAAQAMQAAPAASETRIAQGATLDLRGSALATALLGGAGTVSGGAVTVTETLAVDPAAPLTVGDLALDASGVVDCGRTAEDPLPTKGTFVLVHADQVTGSPSAWTVTGTGWEKGRGRARLAVNADQDLVLELSGSGTVITFR